VGSASSVAALHFKYESVSAIASTRTAAARQPLFQRAWEIRHFLIMKNL
jgi:hypothetical protein